MDSDAGAVNMVHILVKAVALEDILGGISCGRASRIPSGGGQIRHVAGRGGRVGLAEWRERGQDWATYSIARRNERQTGKESSADTPFGYARAGWSAEFHKSGSYACRHGGRLVHKFSRYA